MGWGEGGSKGGAVRMTGSFRNSRSEMPGGSGLRRCENGSEGGEGGGGGHRIGNAMALRWTVGGVGVGGGSGAST